jgi:hypothetical protein
MDQKPKQNKLYQKDSNMSMVLVVKEIPESGREETQVYEHMHELLDDMNRNKDPSDWNMDYIRVYRISEEVFIGQEGFSVISEQKL